jgi:Uma2 family endonuclease
VSTITRPSPSSGLITVEEYERMIEEGEIGEHDQVELIEGRIVVKMGQGPRHAIAAEKSRRPIESRRAGIPEGWHVRVERPVRLPAQGSEPVPDLVIVRGDVEDYDDDDGHPEPPDIGLIVEVARSSLQADRDQAVILGAAGIPAYWIINLPDRQLEVYAAPVAGAYPAPTILDQAASVELVLDGQAVGRIAVADLLPRRS